MGCAQYILYRITKKGLLVDYLKWMQNFYPPDLQVSFTVTFGPKKKELPLPNLKDIRLSLLKEKPELPKFLFELFNQVEDLQLIIEALCWDKTTFCHIISLKPKSPLFTKISTETISNTKDVESIKQAIHQRLRLKRKETIVRGGINCSYSEIINILAMLPEVKNFVELPSVKTALAIVQDSDGDQYPFILKEYAEISDFYGLSFDILEGFFSRLGDNAKIGQVLNELYFDPWIVAGCPHGVLIRDWTAFISQTTNMRIATTKEPIPELLLQDPSYISFLELPISKSDFIVRDRIVRKYIINHLSCANTLESKLTLDFVQNPNNLLNNCPYVVAYQWWPFKIGQTNNGVGDLILSNGYRTFYIVEIKWICRQSGKNNREKRRKARNKVHEQAITYAQYFQQRFPLFNCLPVTYTNEQVWLYRSVATGYMQSSGYSNNITFGSN